MRRDIQLLQIQAHCCKITERHHIPASEILGLFEIICVRGVQIFLTAGHPDVSDLAKYKESYLGANAKFRKATINPYPTAFPYGNAIVLHFYQQQESSTNKTVH